MATISVVIPVFRDGRRAVEAIRAMTSQQMPSGMNLEVVVVDDCSGDGTFDALATIKDPRVRVHPLPQNRGRSGARNAGAAEVVGEVIVFMDCDCVPTTGDFLASHVRALDNAVASTGRVVGDEDDFWSRYQSEASRRRRHMHTSGIPYSGSSQNLAVRMDAFRAVGGFDTAYRQYGFEDRDLLLKLAQVGPIAWTEEAVVRHRDRLGMRLVARKMAEAGCHSSTRFAAMHPDAYAALGYARLDARRNHVLQAAGRIVGGCVPFIAAAVDGLIALPLPHALKAWAVRGTTALAYFSGTAHAEASAIMANR